MGEGVHERRARLAVAGARVRHHHELLTCSKGGRVVCLCASVCASVRGCGTHRGPRPVLARGGPRGSDRLAHHRLGAADGVRQCHHGCRNHGCRCRTTHRRASTPPRPCAQARLELREGVEREVDVAQQHVRHRRRLRKAARGRTRTNRDARWRQEARAAGCRDRRHRRAASKGKQGSEVGGGQDAQAEARGRTCT